MKKKKKFRQKIMILMEFCIPVYYKKNIKQEKERASHNELPSVLCITRYTQLQL